MKVIGLISGTSVDGIDAALVEITGRDFDLQVELLAGATYPYPPDLKERILRVCGGAALSVAELARLDDEIALSFAIAAREIQQKHPPAELIGSHGQTIYHRSPQENNERTSLGYSLQIGRGEIIAQETETIAIDNFRVADIAAGGEGAPLVPKIDVCLLAHPNKYRAIQNLGGIGNVTYIPPTSNSNWLQQVSGWDTGPANILLDLAIKDLTGGVQSYDLDGKIAASGTPNLELVAKWLEQDFFQNPPPKSTGRELFGKEYLRKCQAEAAKIGVEEADWIATLAELTIASIIQSYRDFMPQFPQEILLCGGGSRNLYLRQRLQAELTSAQILTTNEVGLHGDFKEAIAFAVLAYWRYREIPGNLPRVTGASRSVLLGNIHYPPKLVPPIPSSATV